MLLFVDVGCGCLVFDFVFIVLLCMWMLLVVVVVVVGDIVSDVELGCWVGVGFVVGVFMGVYDRVVLSMVGVYVVFGDVIVLCGVFV